MQEKERCIFYAYAHPLWTIKIFEANALRCYQPQSKRFCRFVVVAISACHHGQQIDLRRASMHIRVTHSQRCFSASQSLILRQCKDISLLSSCSSHPSSTAFVQVEDELNEE